MPARIRVPAGRHLLAASLLIASCFTTSNQPLRAQEDQAGVAFAFSEGSGTTAADLSGNGNTGTLMNGAGWTTSGRFGSALLLDGVNDGVQVPGRATLDLTTALTFESWVQVSGPADYRAIWTRGVWPTVHDGECDSATTNGGVSPRWVTASDARRSRASRRS